MTKLQKHSATGGILAALALGVLVGASAEVFPVAWDQPEAEALATSGSVVMGGGGISLFPDVVSTRNADGTNFVNAAMQIIDDTSCTDANRGEIRLGIIRNVHGAEPPQDTDTDALCFCRRSTTDPSGGAFHMYRWVCLSETLLAL